MFKKKSKGTDGVSTLVTEKGGSSKTKTKSQKRKDAANAIKNKDTDAMKKAASDYSDKAMKEGKKKMGYLKRGMETKMLERIIGNLEHSDEEKERRAAMERLLSALKRTKDLTQGTLDVADKMIVKRLAFANATHQFAESLNSKAKVAGSQTFRTIAGLAQGYVDLIGSDMLNHIDEVDDSVNLAREEKEEFYQTRLYHDKYLVQSTDEQTKLQMGDDLSEKKREKIQQAATKAQELFDEAVVAYAEREKSCKEMMARAMEKRDALVVRGMLGMVDAGAEESSQISLALGPMISVLEHTRLVATDSATKIEEMAAFLLDEDKYPDVGLAHIPTGAPAPVLVPAAPESPVAEPAAEEAEEAEPVDTGSDELDGDNI